MLTRRLITSVVLVLACAATVRAQLLVSVNGTSPSSTVSVGPGDAASVTVSSGPGHATDWMGLYAAGAPDGAFLDWRYLSGSTVPPVAGLTDATLNFVMPVMPGDYEFRLFASNGYSRLATTGLVVVTASTSQLAVNGMTAPTTVSVAAGAHANVTVTGGPANPADWVGLFPVDVPDGGFLAWQYLNGSANAPATGLATAMLTFEMPTVPGSYEFRFFLNNGYARLATSPTVVVTASTTTLAVNGVSAPDPISVVAGSRAVVTVSNGPANPTDWVGWYASGGADTSYLDWRYLSGTTIPPPAGLSAGTLRFAMPTTAGSYEFRMFASDGYNRLATSSPVTIAASTAHIAVNGIAPPASATATAGSVATIDVTSGPSNAGDWVGIYTAGTPDGSFLTWAYLNGSTAPPLTGVASASLTFTLPTSAGTYEARLFADNSYNRLTTSAPIIIAATAHVTVNGVVAPASVTARPGDTVTVHVSGAPGNTTDWIGLAPSGSPDASYLTWQYLNGSTSPPAVAVTDVTLSFAIPPSDGTYEFRLFANNGYGRLATSATVNAQTVITAPSITSVAPMSGSPGSAVTIIGTGFGATQANSSVTFNGVAADVAGWSASSLTVAVPSSATSGPVQVTVAGLPSNTVGFTVTAPVVTIQLTSPFAGTGFSQPATINLEAATTVSNGSITKVDFFAGTTLVGTATTTPYQLSWSGMSSGSYMLKANATDNLGGVHVSNGVVIAVIFGQNNNGTLGAPVASLPAGTYGPNHTITLAADLAATIRFTTDGSAPTQSSQSYSAPIALTQTMVLRAQAFEDRWAPSSVLANAYTIRSNPLTVTPHLSPAPNSAGWNNTPVTVTFTCTDDAPEVTCPTPIQLSDEGAGQSATATASDSLGNQATATVVVNIDRTPVTVTVTSPVDGTTTTESTILLDAIVSDGLSGVASATCNGALATIVSGAVECSITLHKGINSILLQARDNAGNSFSKGLRVTQTGPPTVLTVTPKSLKAIVGDSKTLAVSSEYGKMTDATWTSSDPSVVAVAADGSGKITALAPGQVTVTAANGSLSASAAVTVVDVFAPGDTRWSMSTSAQSSGSLIPAHQAQMSGGSDDPASVVVSEMTGPDFFTFSWDSQVATISAATANGVQLWTETTPAYPLFADLSGGVVAESWDPAGFEKIGGSATAPPWQYQSPDGGWIQSAAVQGADGTIYFVEGVSDNSTGNDDGYVVGLDGKNGQVKFRTLLPPFTRSFQPSSRCAQRPFLGREFSSGPLGIGGDGAAYLEVETGHSDSAPVCDYPDIWLSHTDCCQWYTVPDTRQHPGAGTYDFLSELKVVRVDSSGSLSVTPTLAQSSSGGPDKEPVLNFPSFGSVVGDGQQGVLASWTYSDAAGNDNPGFVRVVDNQATQLPSSLAPYGYNPVQMATSSGTVYLWDSAAGVSAAVEVNTWSTLWMGHPNATPVLETDDGNLVAVEYSANYDSASLVEIDRGGFSVATTPIPLVVSPQLLIRGVGILHAVDATTGEAIAITIPEYTEVDEETRYQSLQNFDRCLNPPPTTLHKSLMPGALYTYGAFVGDWTDWDDKKAAIFGAFTVWDLTNVKHQLSVTFAPAVADSGAPNFNIYRGIVKSAGGLEVAGGYNPAGKVLPNGHVTGGLVAISNNVEKFISTNRGTYRATLHEIGHAMGLDHTNGGNGSSVMNMMNGKDDEGNGIPDRPTSCDIKKAKDYSAR